MPIDRKRQQAELLFKFGKLLYPLYQLVEKPDEQTLQTRARASAKFSADMQIFMIQVEEFATSEPGHQYLIENSAISNEIYGLNNELGDIREDHEVLSRRLDARKKKTIEQILAIPTEVDSEVLEAHSPFQAYCKLKVFFETTSDKIVWADPYMGPGLFHRYLNDLSDSVSVLITKDRGSNGEYQSFLDVSRLYAQEKGIHKYKLVVESGNHDRWLQCDDQIYHLGGSAKDAGRKSPFTIAKLEHRRENFQALQSLIASGTELFGHSQTSHQ